MSVENANSHLAAQDKFEPKHHRQKTTDNPCGYPLFFGRKWLSNGATLLMQKKRATAFLYPAGFGDRNKRADAKKPARLNGEFTKNRIGREKSIMDESL